MNNKIDKVYWACYRKIRDVVAPVWYRFFGHKHHIIKTGLTPDAWYDLDTRLLYGNMELVKWFVENDMVYITPKEYENEKRRIIEDKTLIANRWEEEQWERQYKEQQEILAIYTWWLFYDSRLKEIDKAFDATCHYDNSFVSNPKSVFSLLCCQDNMNEEQKKESDRLRQLYDDKVSKLEKEEKEMLHKIIDLKDRMWS